MPRRKLYIDSLLGYLIILAIICVVLWWAWQYVRAVF